MLTFVARENACYANVGNSVIWASSRDGKLLVVGKKYTNCRYIYWSLIEVCNAREQRNI